MARGAFFDVDYTILASNSGSLFIKYMRRQGQIKTWQILASLYYLARYKLNLLEFEPLAEREVLKYEGQPEQEMIALCEEWYRQMVVDYIYPGARRMLADHAQQGDIPVLLSAATVYLVRPLAEDLGIQHYLCNRLEVAEGIFTGRLVKPLCYGQGKIHWAESKARELGISLEDSYYYSDSITDLPVLERFGHPVAVNPDPLLRKQALARGWPMIRFRLDDQ